MHIEGSIYHRKHSQLDVHKQIHRDAKEGDDHVRGYGGVSKGLDHYHGLTQIIILPIQG